MVTTTWRWYVALITPLTITTVVLPSGDRDLVGALGVALALVAVVVGVRLHRPARPGPWALVTCGAALWVLAAALRAGGAAAADEVAAFVDLTAGAVTVLGALGLQRVRGPVRPEAAIDALVVAVVAALLAWVFVVEPGLTVAGEAGPGWWIAVGTALLDVLLAAQLAHLVVTAPVHDRPAARLVTAACAVLLVRDVLLHTVAYLGTASGPGALGLVSVGAFALLGAAALHAPSRGVSTSDGRTRPFDRRAVLLVGSVMGLVPLLGLVGPVVTSRRNLLEVSVAGTAVSVLLVARLLSGVRRTKEQAEHLEHVAGTDALTGLVNGRRFAEHVDEHLTSAGRGGTVVLLVAVLRFSEINETLGMQTGDDLLRATAARLDNAVGRRGTVARLSGATFGVLLHGDPDPSAARATAEAVRSAFHASFLLPEVTVSLDVAVGCALSGEGTGATELLHRADVALAVARERSDGVAHYAGEMETGGALAAQLMGELHHAISASQVVVHFQPQVELLTGRVVGVEALARWHHPQYGTLGPASFVPGTERTGLIRPLTLHVLDSSLAAATRWRTAGRELRVAVNLSVRNLLDPELVEDVRRALQRHRLPAHLLELEITETMVMLDPARSLQALHQLHALGVTLAVDDYGTGYSSLAYLQRLPVHRLKIDRSFVAAVRHDRASAVIVQSTIELARRLGLTVVAEGVEDEATLVALVEMHCAVGQGFGLGRPVPEADVLPAVDWIESHAGRVALRVPDQRVGDVALAAAARTEPRMPA